MFQPIIFNINCKMQAGRQRSSLDPLQHRLQPIIPSTTKGKPARRSLSVNSNIKNGKIGAVSIPVMPKQIKNKKILPHNSIMQISKNKIQDLNRLLQARGINKQAPQELLNLHLQNRHIKTISTKPNLRQIYPFVTAHKQHPNTINARPTPQRKALSTLHPTAEKGLSSQALYLRKESHLNSFFNVRKNRLKQITKQNKKIYVRINSQKSLYSSRQLNKSYESNCSLSRRLSQSKLSRNSNGSSRGSLAPSSREGPSSRQKNKAISMQTKKVVIESHDIETIKGEQMKKFINIFSNKLNVKQNKYPQALISAKNKKKYEEQTEHVELKENNFIEKYSKPLLLPKKVYPCALQKIVEECSNGPSKIGILKQQNRMF